MALNGCRHRPACAVVVEAGALCVGLASALLISRLRDSKFLRCKIAKAQKANERTSVSRNAREAFEASRQDPVLCSVVANSI